MVNINKRILYLDQLRSLAIICVIVGHVCTFFGEGSYTNWIVSTSLISIVRVGVPLFLMVSGALLLNRQLNMKIFFKKRARSVVVPFICWTFIFSVFGLIYFSNFTGYELSIKYFIDVLFGFKGVSSISWFIWFLLGIYLLIPIVNSFILEKGNDVSKYLLLLIFIFSILFSLGFFTFEFKNLFRSIYYFVNAIAFYILGYYIRYKEFNVSDKKLVIIGIVLFIFGASCNFYSMYTIGYGNWSINKLDFFNIFVIVETIGVFLVFRYFNVKMISSKLKPLKETFMSKLVISYSLCTFGIFFFHWILILYIAYNPFFEQFRVGKAYIWIPVFSISIALLSWLVIWILSKIPILKICSGVK